MDIQQYIETGILESVILGSGSSQEVQEIECLRKIYPELQEAHDAMLVNLEQYAHAHAIVPPSDILGKIKNRIEQAAEVPNKMTVVESENARGSIVYKKQFPTWLAAASFLLLFGVGMFAWQSNSVNKNLKADLANLKADQEKLKSDITKSTELMTSQQQYVEVSRDPAYQRVVLSGTEQKAPDSKVTVFWNTNNQEVYLDVISLPSPPAGKQYQLWSIDENGPKSAGVIHFAGSEEGMLQRMEMTQTAQTFAITLENFGGVPSPTLEELYVIGNVTTS